MWSKTCFLILETTGVDDSGDITTETTTSEVFCSEVSVRQSEFYQAMAVKLKPEISLKIYRFEYDSQKKVRCNDRVYDLIRADTKGEDFIVLVLGGGVDGTAV